MERLIKSWFTTITGIVLIILSIYFWSVDEINDTQAVGMIAIGFVFMYVKEKVSAWIENFVNAAIEKLFKLK